MLSTGGASDPRERMGGARSCQGQPGVAFDKAEAGMRDEKRGAPDVISRLISLGAVVDMVRATRRVARGSIERG